MNVDARIIRAGGTSLASFLALVVSSWRSALGRNLAGVYVQGSLSTGAFNPRTSDTARMLEAGSPRDRSKPPASVTLRVTSAA